MEPIEIKVDLSLSDDEQGRMRLHSLHNAVNVLQSDLHVLCKLMSTNGVLQESLDLCKAIIALYREDGSRDDAACLENLGPRIRADVDEALRRHPIAVDRLDDAEAAIESVHRIVEMVGLIALEVQARHHTPGAWERVASAAVIQRMHRLFDAIAHRAHGRYGIVYDPAGQLPTDYLILFDVRGAERDWITVPAVLLEVLGDLTANARKYAKPGSSIESILRQDAEEIILQVNDRGRGIPENEIIDVVGFGTRGSNVTSAETRGGGFGLTKAYYVCKRFGGRMWIASATGEGTRITLRIPFCPVEA